jgi:hypothetical protein
MASTEQLTKPDHREIAKMVVERFEQGKDRHKATCDKWDRFYAKYRAYREFKRTYAQASSRDVDEVISEARIGFGADLFIPYTFSVIETTVPQMLAANPKMIVTPAPLRQAALPMPVDLDRLEDAAETIKLMMDKSQAKIRYELVLQDIAKNGLMYGIGWQKNFWKTEMRAKTTLQPAMAPRAGDPAYQPRQETQMVFDGPMAECVDPYEIIHDPVAYSMETCRWIIHRTWRDNGYLRRMFESGVWQVPDGVTLEEIESAGSEEQRTATWKERMAAAGYPEPETRGDHLHEVWEFHDRQQVVTLIDRSIPVQVGPNPYWHGQLPFAVFRPTRVPHEMVGIGEIEAISDLQDELNALRSQRRDNAALVLQRPMAYFDGMLDPADAVFGPGSLIPTDASPQDVLFPIPLQDIPASSYNEEDRMQRDIERISGISDAMAGGGGDTGGTTETATGAQLVHAAANIRIQNKTRLLEHEVVRPSAEQWLELFQQKITSTMFIPGPPKPGEAYKPWSWYQVDPALLAGEWAITPDGGSMAPENVPQKRDDATRLFNMFAQDPMVRPEKVREEILTLFDIKNAQSWIVPQQQMIPPEAVQMMLQQLAQIDPALAQAAEETLNEAIQMAQMAGSAPPGQPQGGAGFQQLPQGAQNGGPEPAAAGNPEQNGRQ